MASRCYFVSPNNVADHRRGGASICSLAYLQALAAYAPGRVTLVSPLSTDRMPELPSGVDEVVEVPERRTISKLWHLAAGNSVDRLSPFMDRFLRSVDVRGSVFFMNSSRGGRFSALLRRRGVPSITLFHNVEADFFAVSERESIKRRLLVRAADRNDRLAFRHSAASVFLTGVDAEVMRRRAVQEVRDAIIVERGFFAPSPLPQDPGALPPSTQPEILVNCSLGLPQNVPGLIEFLEQWRIAADRPGLSDATVVLAGSSPPQNLLALAASLPRVRVVASPSDEQMERLFASCRVCVSTIDAGSGIKVRVAEALRRGRPVVATPHSCIGYEDIDARVLRKVGIGSMMSCLAEVLSPASYGELERTARAEFQDKLSYDAGSAAFEAVLSKVERRAGIAAG